MEKVKDLLIRIYGEQTGALVLERIAPIIGKYGAQKKKKASYFFQEDVVLITYGDSLKKDGEAPLKTLHEFANRYLNGAVSNIHFLPFFPYSSDDGFSVMDFFEIDPELAARLEPVVKRIYARHDYHEYGGAPLLGVNGVVIVGHGRSSALAIKHAIDREARRW